MPMSENIWIALEVQQKAYRDLIDVVRSTFNDRIKQLEANHNELTASLQFTQREVDDLKKTSTEKDEEINRMKKEMAELKKQEVRRRNGSDQKEAKLSGRLLSQE
ncbi:hypothetical protein Pmani_006791 [Petrolisthes manimaculis]|uniref:Uncharacterized protein n=1 Tax=Petrolisthes manimaculis TaxID=1843537 RepID=A0AAE1Q9X0_9EUCA|nr:hypothetical protein Pmani_006791 [Petrolisthes manimaculis]